jgi:hypothetical protein
MLRFVGAEEAHVDQASRPPLMAKPIELQDHEFAAECDEQHGEELGDEGEDDFARGQLSIA